MMCMLIETRLGERLAGEGIEIDRIHTTADDPSYGPSLIVCVLWDALW